MSLRDRNRLNLQHINGHIQALDGLRGLAIILVLLYHLFPFFPLSKFGWSGVDLFFVLSGFLITGILLDTLHEKYYWRNFITRRVLRIFPLYYFSLLLFVLIASLSSEFASSPVVNYPFFAENQLWYWLYMSNIRMFIEGTWLPTIVFNPLWSLSIEEQFYLAWPLIIYSLKGRNLFLFVCFFILSIILIRFIQVFQQTPVLSIYVFTFTRLDTILTGSLIAITVRNKTLRNYLEQYTVFIFAAASIILVSLFLVQRTSSPFNYHVQFYGYTIIALFFGSVLLLAVNQKPNFVVLKSALQSNILVFFGKYSYSLYIFHWPLYRLLRDPLKKFYLDSIHIKQPLLINTITSFSILIATIICSLITWNLFEKRFIALKSVLAPKGKTRLFDGQYPGVSKGVS